MDHLDPFVIDRQARALRRQEFSRLVEDLACAARKAWSRLSRQPAPLCAPTRGLAA